MRIFKEMLNHLLEYREKDRVMINNLDQKFNDFQKFVKKEFLETKINISKLNKNMTSLVENFNSFFKSIILKFLVVRMK